MKEPKYAITRRENPETKATEAAVKGLARGLLPVVTKYFNDEGNRHEFDDWYLKTYGTPYVWKTRSA